MSRRRVDLPIRGAPKRLPRRVRAALAELAMARHWAVCDRQTGESVAIYDTRQFARMMASQWTKLTGRSHGAYPALSCEAPLGDERP